MYLLIIPNSFKFQFLIGTLKTIVDDFIGCLNIYVSIPHRYAENYIADTDRGIWWWFQFLIGTLKTKMFKGSPVWKVSFNSS